MFIKVE